MKKDLSHVGTDGALDRASQAKEKLHQHQPKMVKTEDKGSAARETRSEAKSQAVGNK